MSTQSYAVRDSATMLRRNLRHVKRYPSMAASTVGFPVLFLLLFGYVFGSTLGAGLGGGRAGYIDYLVPGILVLTVASGSVSTAVSVNMDMTEGIVARFRTMAIARVSLLTGHVLGNVIQTMVGVILVAGVGLAMGFRTSAGPAGWLGVAGLLLLLTVALTWLSVAFGVVADRPETASNLPMPLMLLPLLGSGFVPTASMPPVVRQFAEYQPFTPITQTVRGLLMGTPAGNNWIIAIGWCVGIGLAGYLWAKAAFNRDTVSRSTGQ